MEPLIASSVPQEEAHPARSLSLASAPVEVVAAAVVVEVVSAAQRFNVFGPLATLDAPRFVDAPVHRYVGGTSGDHHTGNGGPIPI